MVTPVWDVLGLLRVGPNRSGVKHSPENSSGECWESLGQDLRAAGTLGYSEVGVWCAASMERGHKAHTLTLVSIILNDSWHGCPHLKPAIILDQHLNL